MTEITYRIGTYGTETTPMHIWEIADDQGVASALYVSLDHLEIMNIETRDDRMREGLARSLYAAATTQLGEIFHSLPAHRTPEGEAFANAVGGDEVTECHIDACCCTEIDEY